MRSHNFIKEKKISLKTIIHLKKFTVIANRVFTTTTNHSFFWILDHDYELRKAIKENL